MHLRCSYVFWAFAAMASALLLRGQAPQFTISTVAGTGAASYTGEGGLATNATLNDPRGLVTDTVGNLYFCDHLNHVVRKIDTSGKITTIAGTGVAGYNGDNIPAATAQLNYPWRVSIDPAGNLYIADAVNDRIRKVTPDGMISTVAGNGSPGYTGDGGPATSATLQVPEQAEFDVYGNMFIADSYNNVVRKVAPDGTITTFAGTGFGAGIGNHPPAGGSYTGDGGLAAKATLNLPVSVAVDPAGSVYISDQINNVIRKVDLNGIITTVAGVSGVLGYNGDGGPATSAVFAYPAGIALDSSGDLYITDIGNSVLRVMLADGTMNTAAGNGVKGHSGDGGLATSAELNVPRQVVAGTFGDIYIADSANNAIRQLKPTSATTLGHITNAFGDIPIIAPNTWMIIKGTNLSAAGHTRPWKSSDFVDKQMPTALDSVSVTFTGPNGYSSKGYVYYISPTQLNILTPPDLPAGVVNLEVNNNGNLSRLGLILSQAISPTFFVFNGGPYIIATHLDGSLVGPTTLYPGLSTPAVAGDYVVIYANGFGPTSKAVVAGSMAQGGTLPTKPVVKIGGVQAKVTFAGLISPGLYQFNVVAPPGLDAKDQTIVATYEGHDTQQGTLLTVGPMKK